MDDRVYVTALFIHLAGVVTLFACTGLEFLQVSWLRRATTVGEVQMAERIESALKVLLPVAGTAIIASGLFMLIKGWSWSAHWADVAIVALLAASFVGLAVFTPRVQRILEAAHREPPGPLSESLRAQTLDPLLVTSVWLLAALGASILYLMAVKPQTIESVVAVLVAVALAVTGSRLVGTRLSVTEEAREAEPTTVRG